MKNKIIKQDIEFKSTINLCGVKFKLEFVDYELIDTGQLIGISTLSKAIIQVRNGLNVTVMKQTILHECIHGILNQIGTEHTEEIAGVLGVELLNFLRGNKELIQILQTKHKGE